MKAALLLTGLLAPWAISAALAAALGRFPRLAGRLTAAAGAVSFGAAAAIWMAALGGEVLVAGPGALFRADALSALVACCIAAVSGLAMLPWADMGKEPADTDRARVFRIFGSLFTLAMLVAVTINNVALMWVAIEATTIVSAILIPLHRSKASVEASWKYILIGSVGIALAFAGTVLAYFDFVSLLGRRHDALNWTLLMDVAPTLHPDVLRLAFVFLLVGYGTKAGPRADAHVAARRALGGAGAAVGHDVGRAAGRGAVRDHPLEGGGRRGGRAGVHQPGADGAGPALGRHRRAQPGAPAELQAAAGVLERRAQRPHLPGAHLRAGRRVRLAAAPAEPRPREVDELPARRPHPRPLSVS